MSENESATRLHGGQVCFWIEQGTSVHLKAASGKDPVELTWDQARELGRLLIAVAEAGERAESEADQHR